MSLHRVKRCALATTLFVLPLAPSIVIAQGKVELAGRVMEDTAKSARGTAGSTSDGLRADSISTVTTRTVAPALLHKRDLGIAAGFAAAAVALFPLDRDITRWARNEAFLENGALRSTMAGAEWGVEKGSVIAGVGLWGSGVIARNRTVAEMGWHTLVSIGVTQQITYVLKGAFGRSRPYVSADSTAHDWQWASGFGTSDRRSFPSGHASTAFAFATALSGEISHAWPRAGRIATPLLYLGATSAALARVYHDQHWLSDVTLGAAVGILTARTTTRFLHRHPDNFLDKVALNTRIVPQEGGAAISVTLSTH